MTDESNAENTHKFVCLNCDFKCCKKSDWNRHILTQKHIKLTDTDINTDANTSNYICNCGKKYKHRQSLFNHKKTCQNIYIRC
jgi:hypothetical protein